MKVILKLGMIESTNMKKYSYGLFQCPFCNQVVKKLIQSGKRSKSCGCAKDELIGIANSKHRCYRTLLYKVWSSMKARCQNPNRPAYKNYGGRGIVVCDEWINDFLAFKKWAFSHGYRKEVQLDRKDNNKGYFPENCHFITHSENSRNRRDVKLNWDIVKEIRQKHSTGNYTQRQLAKNYNISFQHISKIIRRTRWVQTTLS